MSAYREMIEIACFVASYPLDYDKSTIVDMCKDNDISAEAVIDFFERYGNKFGIDTDDQKNWANEILEGDEE